MPKTKKRKPAAPAAEPAPDWVTKTPDEIEYELLMTDSRGEEAEQISLTRGEYISLKLHLATEMRGYKAEEAHA